MDLLQGIRHALRVFAKPFGRQSGPSGVVIRPYRGFGSHKEICVFGSVFRQASSPGQSSRDDILAQLKTIWRRMWRRGLRHIEITADFAGSRAKTKTDRFGFFFLRFRIEDAAVGDGIWQKVTLALVDKKLAAETVEADIFIAPESARYAIISDIDDTVVYTGVVNKVKMMWHLFFTKAESRVAFPGVGALYRALYQGNTGTQHNPMLYVSRGPWSIYEVLESFFNLHNIPVGPVLFLRHWGLTFDHPLPRRSRDHKINFIRHIMALYDDLPFILIGDSGQRDPEVYARIVHENPGRVLAVYIRDVGSKPGRLQAIAELARETAGTGTTLLLAGDSLSIAQDAVQQQLIGAEALREVEEACRQDESGAHQPGLLAQRLPASKQSSFYGVKTMRSVPGKYRTLFKLVSGIEITVLVSTLLIAAGIWGFVELADEVMEGETATIDRQILLAMRTAADPSDPIGPLWFEESMRDLTALGSTAVLLLVSLAVIGFLLLKRKHGMALLMVLSVGGGLLLSTLLKQGFNRPRPDLVPHGSYVMTASFPSGHSMLSAVVFLTVGGLLARYIGTRHLKIYVLSLSILTTLLVGFSRVYLGVHWPTDVLAGWSAGASWALICWFLAVVLQRRGQVESSLEE